MSGAHPGMEIEMAPPNQRVSVSEKGGSMKTMLEREGLKTLERPKERMWTTYLWIALVVVIVAVAATVGGFVLFGDQDEGIDVNFDRQSSYVPAGAAEIAAVLTEPAVSIDFGAGSAYVPAGASELAGALAASGMGIDFGVGSAYVPAGARELADALRSAG